MSSPLGLPEPAAAPPSGSGAVAAVAAGGGAAGPSNLPLQLTSFVGRTRELAEVARLLDTTRLLTLTGPGGTGKTRLALRAAAAALPAYPDGVRLIELAALADAALVPQAVAAATGVREAPAPPPRPSCSSSAAARSRPRKRCSSPRRCCSRCGPSPWGSCCGAPPPWRTWQRAARRQAGCVRARAKCLQRVVASGGRRAAPCRISQPGG